VPVTKKPTEVRMGKGKGSVEFWAAAAKLPVRTKIVMRPGEQPE